MEKKIEELNTTIKSLEEQLVLARAFTDPRWTDENIKAAFVRIANNDEIVQAILAMIDKIVADIVLEVSNPNSTEHCRTHGMGGVFWLSTLATDIQNNVQQAQKTVFEKLSK